MPIVCTTSPCSCCKLNITAIRWSDHSMGSNDWLSVTLGCCMLPVSCRCLGLGGVSDVAARSSKLGTSAIWRLAGSIGSVVSVLPVQHSRRRQPAPCQEECVSVLQRLALGNALLDCMCSCKTAAMWRCALYHTTGTVIATTIPHIHAAADSGGRIPNSKVKFGPVQVSGMLG
jgi:hypothetical protein